MKITDVKTVLLTGPSTNDPFLREARGLRSAAIIEIHTDGPHMGVGETYAGYFCPELIPHVVDLYKPILLGVDVIETDVHTLWQRMYFCENFWGRTGLGPAVLSGIEGALWDLKGKTLGLPVWQLLGGKHHDRLPCYATGGPSNWPVERLKEKVDFYLSLGFRAFKVGAGYWDGKERRAIPTRSTTEIVDMEASKADILRQHIGPDIRLCMDGHMGNPASLTDAWTLPIARSVLQALEPYNLFFYEEPLPYSDPWGYAELCRSTSIRVAGGECLTTFNEFRQYVDMDALVVGQPDAGWVGGLLEFIRIARLFDSRNKKVATHSWGSGAAQLQNLHAAFAVPNPLILEIPPAAGPLHTEIWGDSFVMKDGYVYPPTAPGLGVRWNDDIKNRYPFVPGSGEFNSVPGKILTT